MHTSDALIGELKDRGETISDKHFNDYVIATKKDPASAFDNFMQIIFINFRSDLASAATDLIHKSIMVGVDDRMKFVTDIQTTNAEIAQSLMHRVQEYNKTL